MFNENEEDSLLPALLFPNSIDTSLCTICGISDRARKESPVNLFYKGKSMECFARVIEDDETVAVPRLAEYLRHFHADRLGITPETTKEKFDELVTAAAKTYPIVAIRAHSSVSGSHSGGAH